MKGSFDAVYSLDVLEHIDASQEDKFIANMITPLTEHGVLHHRLYTVALESQA